MNLTTGQVDRIVMVKSIIHDFTTLFLAGLGFYMLADSLYINETSRILMFIGFGTVLGASLINIVGKLFVSDHVKFTEPLNIFAMLASFLNIVALITGKVYAQSGSINRFWDGFPLFGFHLLLSFVAIVLVSNSAAKVENAFVVLLTIPVLLVAMASNFIVFLIDLFFPPRIQELIPYIDALRTLVLNVANTMSDPQRLEAEAALKNLGEMTSTVDDIGEGYALRKGLGQGIDLGLTFIVFVGFGVLNAVIGLGIPQEVVIIFFGSLGLALATFSGFFGPFYGLAQAAKEFSLKHGNYRGAAIFKAIEQLFAIPFLAASAGFLLLDLPPVDAATLDEFKNDMQDQIQEINDNINDLLGKSGAAVPRKTQKLLATLMGSTKQNLGKLDFRNVREDTAREFALTYYQHEFSWKPWQRKSAVAEFAKTNHFDIETGEQTLKLIGYKIEAGQMDDDLVSNVMISASMRGVIMMEQKYQELFEDVELGQTCTGLAFGARQFLKDHYIVRSKKRQSYDLVKNFLLGVFVIPVVLIIGFHKFANRFFDFLGQALWNQHIADLNRIRYAEIKNTFLAIPDKIRAFRSRPKKTKEEKAEERQQRNWQLRRKTRRIFAMIWQVLSFPVVIFIGLIKWIVKKLGASTPNPREEFEEAVSHAALVAMYNELYNKLVKQDHVFSAY